MPFVILSDFESIIVPVQGAKPNTEQELINTFLQVFPRKASLPHGEAASPEKSYRGKDCVNVLRLP